MKVIKALEILYTYSTSVIFYHIFDLSNVLELSKLISIAENRGQNKGLEAGQ